MNGRIYDPLLGRFLSADAIVEHPVILQSFNRYSYVKNNPLSFTDPTGYSSAGMFWNSGPDEVMTRMILGEEAAQEVRQFNAIKAEAQVHAGVTVALSAPLVGEAADIGIAYFGDDEDKAFAMASLYAQAESGTLAPNYASVKYLAWLARRADDAADAGQDARRMANQAGETSSNVGRLKANQPQVNVTKDELGRISNITTSVSPENLGSGTGTTQAARTMAQGREEGLQAGHILAKALGGRGGKNSDNIVPMLGKVNQRDLAQFEKRLVNNIRKNGEVNISIDLKYGKDGINVSGDATDLIYRVTRTVDGEEVEVMSDTFKIMN